MLSEAGLRLPQEIGHAVSIVGGLIIGDAAISAGIVSAPMVIIAAFAYTGFEYIKLMFILVQAKPCIKNRNTKPAVTELRVLCSADYL